MVLAELEPDVLPCDSHEDLSMGRSLEKRNLLVSHPGQTSETMQALTKEVSP